MKTLTFYIFLLLVGAVLYFVWNAIMQEPKISEELKAAKEQFLNTLQNDSQTIKTYEFKPDNEKGK